MEDTTIPAVRPANPRFSSGPCAKAPGFSLDKLADAALGRSHRAAVGKAKLKAAIDRTRQAARPARGLSAGHRAGLGHRRCRDGDVVAARPAPGRDAGLGELRRGLGRPTQSSSSSSTPPSARRPMARSSTSPRSISTSDVVFTWNGTTSGVRVPNGDAIPADRKGLTICDATSAAFAMDAAVRQARCRHLLLAEGAGRRGGAWDAGRSRPAPSSGWKATPRPGRCRRSSA